MINSLESRVLDINSEALGVPTSVLMENAGKAVAEEIIKNYDTRNILVVCGTGNNGGDGAVAARYLAESGWQVTLALVKPRSAIKSQKLVDNLGKLPGAVGVIEQADPKIAVDFRLILDAMLGTGLKDSPREPYASWISMMNKIQAKVVSIDVPSGFGTDRAILPDMTVSMHDSKEGMNEKNSGTIAIVDIGIPKEAEEYVGPGDFVYYPLPAKESHKGQNGRLLIIGGGPYTGAPALSGMAALAVGVDLVWIASPEVCAQTIASYTPNFIVRALKGDKFTGNNLEEIKDLLATVDAVLVGPGLGRDPDTVKAVCKLMEELMIPVLVDADGLYALSKGGTPVLGVPAVFTPHRKEFAGLAGAIPELIGPNEVAEMARETSSVIVLKGPEDIISDGDLFKKNRTGNPAMSVGGTGDVLAGLIAGLLAKGAEPFAASRMGAFLSGRAGDIAFDRLGYSMTATDVIASIPEVLKEALERL